MVVSPALSIAISPDIATAAPTAEPLPTIMLAEATVTLLGLIEPPSIAFETPPALILRPPASEVKEEPDN